MADDYNEPSMDPALEGTLLGVIKLAFKKFQQQTDDMIPARVVALDRKNNRVTLQPMIKVVGTDGTEMDRAQVVSVPVYRPGGGGFHISFPIKEGDIGYLKAMDRDVSLWRQGYEDRPPNTQRMKSFEDGLFFPDQAKPWAPEEMDLNGAVISSTDGSVRIVLDNGEARITAPKLTINASEGVDFVGGPIKHNGVNIGDTHTHGGVESGPGTSGPPNN